LTVEKRRELGCSAAFIGGEYLAASDGKKAMPYRWGRLFLAFFLYIA